MAPSMARFAGLLSGLLLGALVCSGESQQGTVDAASFIQSSVDIPVEAQQQSEEPTEAEMESVDDDDEDEDMDEAEAAAPAEAEAESAQDMSGSFELGSTVYVHDQQGTIVWDGRPEHEFVKLKWLSGKEKGKTSEIIPVSQVKVSGPNVTAVVSLASGRHMSKHSAAAAKKVKPAKVQDFSRRRRGVIRRIVYGVKHLPMVASIPFKGLHTGVSTITSEMTAHTGVAFNGSITDLLGVGRGEKIQQQMQQQLSRQEGLTAVVTAPPKPKVNLRELMRNKTVKAVMKSMDKSISPILGAFNSEVDAASDVDAPAPGPVA